MSLVSENLLIRLFSRHYDDPVAAVQRMERNLAAVELPFGDFHKQVREVVFPPHPHVPNGVRSLVYYFVPGSGWGTAQPLPDNPLEHYTTKTADGIGLNMGCPVRLARALDILRRLKAEDPSGIAEVEKNLRAATKHLATVEELLWLSGWKSPSAIRRGDRLVNAKHVDWFLKSSGHPIHLESKFRPSDWPAHTDQGTFHAIEGSLLGKAAEKFPPVAKGDILHVVGITGLADLTEERLHQLGHELETHDPKIHAVVYRSMAQMTHVIALHQGWRDRVLAFVAVPSARDFPTNYSVLFHVEQRDERVKLRSAQQPKPIAKCAKVLCWDVTPTLDAAVPNTPQGVFQVTITGNDNADEPIFQVIPRKI